MSDNSNAPDWGDMNTLEKIGASCITFAFLALLYSVGWLFFGGDSDEQTQASQPQQVDQDEVAQLNDAVNDLRVDYYLSRLVDHSQQLERMRHSPTFHTYGFGAAGPFRQWELDRQKYVKELQVDKRRGLTGPVRAIDTAFAALFAVALDYIATDGAGVAGNERQADYIRAVVGVNGYRSAYELRTGRDLRRYSAAEYEEYWKAEIAAMYELFTTARDDRDFDRAVFLSDEFALRLDDLYEYGAISTRMKILGIPRADRDSYHDTFGALENLVRNVAEKPLPDFSGLAVLERFLSR